MVRDWVEEKDAAATKESITVPTGFGMPRDRLFSDKMLYFSYRRGLRRALLLSQKYGGRIRRGSGNIVI